MYSPAILLCLHVLAKMLEPYERGSVKWVLSELAEILLGMLQTYALWISLPVDCLADEQDDHEIPLVFYGVRETTQRAIFLVTLEKYGREAANRVMVYMENWPGVKAGARRAGGVRHERVYSQRRPPTIGEFGRRTKARPGVLNRR